MIDVYVGSITTNTGDLLEEMFQRMLLSAEACGEGFIKSASRYQIIAREENGTGQDDGMLRAWYAEWSKLTQEKINEP